MLEELWKETEAEVIPASKLQKLNMAKVFVPMLEDDTQHLSEGRIDIIHNWGQVNGRYIIGQKPCLWRNHTLFVIGILDHLLPQVEAT